MKRNFRHEDYLVKIGMAAFVLVMYLFGIIAGPPAQILAAFAVIILAVYSAKALIDKVSHG